MQPESDFSWMTPIEVMLGSLNHGEVHACSISSVSDAFRDPKDNTFKPKFVSIGPLHRGATTHMQLMEETKWRYMSEFLNRITDPQEKTKRLRDCGTEILNLDNVIRATYGANINNIELEPHEFAKMMILDGCFLLELLFKLDNYRMSVAAENNESNDPVFKSEKKVMRVLNDITMVENQIPFFVLKKLFRKIFPDGSEIKDDYRVVDLVRKAFGYHSVNFSAAAHIPHVIHMFSTIEQSQLEEQQPARQELVCCATRLRASGVIIQAKENSNHNLNLIHHKLEENFDFNISFQGSVLEIPPLYIKETTEVRWRNLIAWEHSRNWVNCIYTSYALFFQGLICCKHDIKVLVENKVIVNECGKSEDDLLSMFQGISKGAELMDSKYRGTCERLNMYHGTRAVKVLQELPKVSWHECRRIAEIVVYYWRNWYKVLIHDHIPTVWKLIGVLAAAFLLVLTVMQTYYSSRTSG